MVFGARPIQAERREHAAANRQQSSDQSTTRGTILMDPNPDRPGGFIIRHEMAYRVVSKTKVSPNRHPLLRTKYPAGIQSTAEIDVTRNALQVGVV